jgi:hypothetical protein
MKKRLDEKQVAGNETKAATKLQAAQRGFRARLQIIKNLEEKVKKFIPNRQNHIQKRFEILKVLNTYKKPPITATEMSTVREYKREFEQMEKNKDANRKRLEEEANRERQEKERLKKEKEEFAIKRQSLKNKYRIIFTNENESVPGLVKFYSTKLPSEIKTEDDLKLFKYTTVNGTQKTLYNTNMNQIKKNIKNAKQVQAERAKSNANIAENMAVKARKAALKRLLGEKKVEKYKTVPIIEKLNRAKTISELETIQEEINRLGATRPIVNTGRGPGKGRAVPGGQTGTKQRKFEKENLRKRMKRGGRASDTK